MFLVEGGSNNDIFLDYDVGAKIYRRHVTAHHDLGVHHIFALHSNVL